MHLLFSIYLAVLFFILTPAVMLRLPKKGDKYTVAAVHAIVFAIILHFSAKIVMNFSRKYEGFREGATTGAATTTTTTGAATTTTATGNTYAQAAQAQSNCAAISGTWTNGVCVGGNVSVRSAATTAAQAAIVANTVAVTGNATPSASVAQLALKSKCTSAGYTNYQQYMNNGQYILKEPKEDGLLIPAGNFILDYRNGNLTPTFDATTMCKK
jgi:hypothetical protein